MLSGFREIISCIVSITNKSLCGILCFCTTISFVCVHSSVPLPVFIFLYIHICKYIYIYIVSVSVCRLCVCFSMPYVFISLSVCMCVRACVFVRRQAICSLSGLVLTPRALSFSEGSGIKKTDMYQILLSDVWSLIPIVY